MILIAGMLPLAACTPDYSAVRDWSLEARGTLLPSPLARVPSAPAAPAPTVAVEESGRAGAVRALQEAAAAWLAALGYLADDGRLSDRENPLTALPPRIAPFDPEGAAAAERIGETLASMARRSWRAPQLAYAVLEGAPAFEAVMAALVRQSDLLAAETPDARAQQDARMAELIAAARQPETRAALQELQVTRQAELDRRGEAAAARRAAIARVNEGHKLLVERARTLSQSETARLLRVQQDELRRLAVIILAG
ncbi:hypothetical protein DFH01_02075 [Falsiroseomonas bella]|uniref:Uncharacterized protein n=1 Tax=Falsiroseomonas bella TaxID=2184016 RepID=A0A317FHN6_9PROT|nr:hypothetical protein [Falsiroseomonas bella]PWS38113.1 hypothetical protein DFH01_02075 [Falsiroseomonas bella]